VFEDAVIVMPLPAPAHERTPFTRFGDSIGPLVALACALIALLAAWRARRAAGAR
jgi:hypothetical protein